MEMKHQTQYEMVAVSEQKQGNIVYHSIQAPQDSLVLESKVRKLLIIPAVIVTTIISVVLLINNTQQWTVSDKYYDRIVNNRATVQVIVQIVAGLCSIGQVVTVRALINYTARRKLSRRSTTLDGLNFFTSLSTSQINWSLPTASLCLILLISVIALIPIALWVGALTPIVAIMQIEEPGSLSVPVYGSDTAHMWKDQGWFSGINSSLIKQSPFGIFTYGPVRDRFSFFIDSGTSASSLDGSPQLNKKSDNSNYTYIGRSYGIGTSVGIADSDLLAEYRRIVRYQFFETGYNTQWKCTYNRTTKAKLEQQTDGAWAALNPTGGGYYLKDLGVKDPPQIVASLSWHMGPWRGDEVCTRLNHTEPDVYLSLVATDAYGDINATQCYAIVTPTIFSVDVNIDERLITVTPVNTKDAKNMDCTGTQSWAATDTLSALSMISTTSYTSAVGNMLRRNIFSVKQQPTKETDAEKTLRGISEALEALADQYLFSEAGAQLMIGNDTIPAALSAATRALRVGQSGFVHAVLIVNVLVLIAVIVEAVRTRLWHGMPKLNFTDVKSAIVAGAYCGDEIVQVMRKEYWDNGSSWDGAGDSRVTGRIKVRLVSVEGSVGLKVEKDI